jgi:hypothetical protein
MTGRFFRSLYVGRMTEYLSEPTSVSLWSRPGYRSLQV